MSGQPQRTLRLSNLANYQSRHFSHGTKCKPSAIGCDEPGGTQSWNIKGGEENSSEMPRRVEACVICSSSVPLAGTAQPRRGRGQAGDRPSPASPDAGRGHVSCLPGSTEPGVLRSCAWAPGDPCCPSGVSFGFP